jgi:hypothetical protein
MHDFWDAARAEYRDELARTPSGNRSERGRDRAWRELAIAAGRQRRRTESAIGSAIARW